MATLTTVCSVDIDQLHEKSEIELATANIAS